MKLLLLLLFLQVGCATKYILPGPRFLTAESQGGAFRGQFDFQQTTANQLALIPDGGVEYSAVDRTGYLVSTSIFDAFDFYWTHVGGGNSLGGGKFQFMGGSRTSNSTGSKMAIAAGFGANKHETEDSDALEFELRGQEFLFLYAYRFTPNVLLYSNLNYSRYNFTTLTSNAALMGARPSHETIIKSLIGGAELSLGPFFTKIESTYQQLETTKAKGRSHFIWGYSLGYQW